MLLLCVNSSSVGCRLQLATPPIGLVTSQSSDSSAVSDEVPKAIVFADLMGTDVRMFCRMLLEASRAAECSVEDM